MSEEQRKTIEKAIRVLQWGHDMYHESSFGLFLDAKIKLEAMLEEEEEIA